jgi:hypothetical protein
MRTVPGDSEDEADVRQGRKERSRTRSISRATAFILVWVVGVPLGHGGGPWVISLLSPRYGWAASGPGIWNALGLMPIALGIAGLVWIAMVAFGESPTRIELRQAPSC